MRSANPAFYEERLARGPTLNYRRLLYSLYTVFICFGILGAMRPSPYDFLFFVVCPLWLLGGVKVHRGVIYILALWCIFEIIGFASLMPHWVDSAGTQFDLVTPRLYQLRSLYIICTVIFFTLFFSERSIERADITLKAYLVGALFCAVLGFLDSRGMGLNWSRDEGRASATFDDPNLYGSYLTLAAVYVLQTILLGTTKRMVFSTLSLFLLTIGIFVSYSRGSWGAFISSSFIMGLSGYLTVPSSRIRRRIALMSGVTVGIIVMTLAALLAQPDIRDMFLERAQVAKEYDSGVTGRFGNQMRSIPMLLDRPQGMGPDVFRETFKAEPHNSYIGAFANDGWAGGFVWIIIVVSTGFVGFRLMFVKSPYQHYAQIFWPVLFAWLLQGFQIDIDHWRQLFLGFGAVWGFEAARQRWVSQQQFAARLQDGEE
jgi:hypothetical protein